MLLLVNQIQVQGRLQGELVSEGPPLKRRRDPSGWSCGHAQKEWILRLRGQIDAATWLSEIPQVRSELWIAHPDHPSLARRRGDASSLALPEPGPFYLQRVGFWLPDKIWGLQPPCPHGEANGAQASCSGVGWAAEWVTKPRRVMSDSDWWLLDTKLYKCSVCQHRFLATHPASIDRLPVWAKAEFGVLMTHKLALDAKLTTLITDHIIDLSDNGVAALINRRQHDTFKKRQLRYL